MSPVRTVAALAAVALLGTWFAPRLLGPRRPAVATPPLPDEPATPPPLLLPTRAPPLPLAPPTGPDPLDATVHVGPAEEDGEHLVVVTVRAPGPDAARAPLDLVVALDTSGSMRRRGRLDQATRALRALAAALAPEDRLGIIRFSDAAAEVRPLAPLPALAELDPALAALEPAGETDLGAGLAAAGAALSGSPAGRARRIVVISDGAANRGEVTAEGLARIGDRLTDEGIGLWTYGLDAEHDSDALSALAGAGGGTYTFVERPRDLPDALREAAEGPGRLVASAVRIDFGGEGRARVVDVPGAGPEVTFDEASVRIGALHAGASRTVVVRVRGVAAEVPTARITWLTPGADAPARALDLGRPSASAPLPTSVATLDAAAALSRAARAADGGRWEEAAAQAERAARRLRDAGAPGRVGPLADAATQADALALALAAPPADPEGRSVLVHRARAVAWTVARAGAEDR